MLGRWVSCLVRVETGIQASHLPVSSLLYWFWRACALWSWNVHVFSLPLLPFPGTHLGACTPKPRAEAHTCYLHPCSPLTLWLVPPASVNPPDPDRWGQLPLLPCVFLVPVFSPFLPLKPVVWWLVHLSVLRLDPGSSRQGTCPVHWEACGGHSVMLSNWPWVTLE